MYMQGLDLVESRKLLLLASKLLNIKERVGITTTRSTCSSTKHYHTALRST